MSALAQAIEDLETQLGNLKPHVPALESIDDELTSAKAALAATKKEQDDVDNQIKNLKTTLAQRQQEAYEQFVRDQTQRTDHLTSLGEQIAKSKDELSDLRGQVAQLRQQHDQVLASMESLRKKLT